MSSYCPYCHSSRSILVGNVYCSKHGAGMEKLDTGTLFIKTPKLEETDWHVSRLSIRMMLNGEQHYNVGNKDCTVTKNNFLVVNQGQLYKTSFEGCSDLEMLMVGFKPGFAESVFQAMVKTDEWLLDNPFIKADEPLRFFEKTYDADDTVTTLFATLKKMANGDYSVFENRAGLDDIYTRLIERLILLHFDIHISLEAKSQVKRSTKIELYKRLAVAKDYMDTYFSSDLALDRVAEVSLLSISHFKFLFKEYYGINPHAYIIRKRLAKAEELLTTSDLPVRAICTSVGFEDPSSFIRLFKNHYGHTPRSLRGRA